MSIKIFYHSADLDGHCSGALLKNRYPTAELFPINYGDRFPWDSIKSDDIVYMVDFSLPMHEMYHFAKCVFELHWIDHHKSAIEAFWNVTENADERDKLPVLSGIRDTNFAACELVWNWLNPGRECPDMIRLLGLYDRWVHDDKPFSWDYYVEPFQYGVRANETDPSKNWKFWEEFFTYNQCEDPTEVSVPISTFLSAGRNILKYMKIRNETEIANRAFKAQWEGLNCLIINGNSDIANSMTSSEMFEGCEVAVNYNNVGNKYWVVNLRSKTIDCSEIAKKYGGGGHFGSAGYQIDKLPMEFTPRG